MAGLRTPLHLRHGSTQRGCCEMPTAQSKLSRVSPTPARPRTQGFIAEMRAVAMRLHTKEQAPAEGKAEKPIEDRPMPQASPAAPAPPSAAAAPPPRPPRPADLLV